MWITASDMQKRLGGDRPVRPGDEPVLREAALTACSVVEDGWVNDRGTLFPGVGPVLFATIPDERVRAGVAKCRVAGLVSVATVGGESLDIADFHAEGQLISRVDGSPVPSPMVVTYTTGWGVTAPEWARAAALAIGEQLFARRFRSAGQADVPIGFLVPRLAEHLLEPYQRASLGFA